VIAPAAVRERPILFTGEMVKAILAGRKTQTRRIVKDPPQGQDLYLQPMWGTSPPPNPVAFGTVGHWRIAGPDYPDDASDDRWCPYGVPGDRLWIRETWARLTGNGHRIVYRADGEDPRTGWDDVPPERRPPMKWRPSIFLTRPHSRLTLEMTGVRVERVQDITRADALAEGVVAGCIPADDYGPERIGYVLGQDDGRSTLYPDERRAFEVGWDSINGKRAPWSSNPWVWVVEFSRLTAADGAGAAREGSP
jgi:hypothetical protein